MASSDSHILPAWIPVGRSKATYIPLEEGSSLDTYEMSEMKSTDTMYKSTTEPAESEKFLDAKDKPVKSPISFERTKKGSWLPQGHHLGVRLCLATTATVLVVNSISLAWEATKPGFHGSTGTVQQGSCEKTKTLSQWLHLAINALSTLLLGASNYSMQCISSPTRREIDRAHQQGIWLDIGVPSVRNLRRIRSSRMILWWLLAVSSVPLHLLYNSAIFASLTTREYDVFLVTKDWVTGAPFHVDSALRDPSTGAPPRAGAADTTGAQQRLEILQNNTYMLEHLSNTDCVQAYANPVVSGRSHVLLVTSLPDEGNNSVLNFLGDIRPGFDPMARNSGNKYPAASDWTCFNNPHCDPGQSIYPSDIHSWSSQISSVDYCLSQKEEDHCKLEFSMIIMVIVIICNLTKTLCMAILVWKKDLQPLTTLGDALASFLESPDPTTKNQCLADRDHYKGTKDWRPTASQWEPKSHRWFTAASGQRWLLCNGLCFATLFVACILLGIGMEQVKLGKAHPSLSYLASLGFGAVNGAAVMTTTFPSGAGGLMVTVLLANTPQAILSFLYLTYNGLFTCMLHAQEWSDYARERKPLRVTSPKGEQRHTYRLQLPYKYGVPLLILSGLLHWLVSQSIFLARITTLNHDGNIDQFQSVSTCGYSPIAIITVIIVGALAVLVGNANGFRRYKPGIQVVGSCSAAISAACHRPAYDADAALKPVMWGAIDNGSTEGSQCHCTFTSLNVELPVKGKLYAGQECQSQRRKH